MDISRLAVASESNRKRQQRGNWSPSGFPFDYDVLLVVDRPFPIRALTKGAERDYSSSSRWTDRDTEDFDRNRYVCKLDTDGYITQRQTNFFLENVHRSISADYRIKYTTDRFARSIRSHFFQFLGSAWALTFI